MTLWVGLNFPMLIVAAIAVMILAIPLVLVFGEAEPVFYLAMAPGVVLFLWLWFLFGRMIDRLVSPPNSKMTIPRKFDRVSVQVLAALLIVLAAWAVTWPAKLPVMHHHANGLKEAVVIWAAIGAGLLILKVRQWRAMGRAATSTPEQSLRA
ncbi:MAG TPA: hypothetical protein VNN18_04960 [Candidatus Xenobia bacterium]|nr:hypothetical protein [Candidatus Xenobia bacterium]